MQYYNSIKKSCQNAVKYIRNLVRFFLLRYIYIYSKITLFDEQALGDSLRITYIIAELKQHYPQVHKIIDKKPFFFHFRPLSCYKKYALSRLYNFLVFLKLKHPFSEPKLEIFLANNKIAKPQTRLPVKFVVIQPSHQLNIVKILICAPKLIVCCANGYICMRYITQEMLSRAFCSIEEKQ
jgi:hypothetical protein